MLAEVMDRIKNRISRNDEELSGQGEIYSEEYFHELLGIERKRTERSRRSFLLMLINTEKLFTGKEGVKVLRKVAEALQASTREIDIKGWYEAKKVLGVIFTEVNADREPDILIKVRINLEKRLTADQVRRIDIRFYRFPEPRADLMDPDQRLRVFYSEL